MVPQSCPPLNLYPTRAISGHMKACRGHLRHNKPGGSATPGLFVVVTALSSGFQVRRGGRSVDVEG